MNKFPILITILLLTFNSFSQNFKTLKGKILDSSSEMPIEGAFIHFADKSQGIISNQNGDFIFKFPTNHLDTSLVIKAFGYESRVDFIENLDSTLIFRMNPVLNTKLNADKFLKMNQNPKFWVLNAFSEIQKLYPVNPTLLLGFYKETSSLNNESAQVKETIIKVERATGTSSEFGDKIKLVKGRTIENQINANVIRKHGFKNGFDIVTKSFESGIPVFFGEDLEDYQFELDSNLSNIDGRVNYIFSFSPENKKVKAARNGKLFIDTLTNAIVRIQYTMTQKGADDVFKDNTLSNIKKSGKEVELTSNYRLHKGKWYLSDSKLKIVTELENALNGLKVDNNLELRYVTTDILKTNGRTINYDEAIMDTDNCKKVKLFDEKFWQNYNFVYPEVITLLKDKKSKNIETASR